MFAKHTPYEIYAMELLGKRNKSTKYNNNFKTTIKSYASPFIGNIPIHEVNSVHIKNIRNFVNSKDMSAAYNNEIRRVIHQPFIHAKRHNLITRDPFEHTWAAAKTKSPYNHLQSDQLEHFMRLIEGHPKIRNLVGLVIFCGMRTEEVLALKWKDVDYINNTITIAKSRKPRKLLLTDYIINEFILNQYNQTRNRGPDDYIFSGPNGRMLRSESDIGSKIRQICKHSSLPPVTLRNLRTTFCLMESTLGDNFKQLQEYAGFKSTEAVFEYKKLTQNKQ